MLFQRLYKLLSTWVLPLFKYITKFEKVWFFLWLMFKENILQEMYLTICLGAIGILGCGVIYPYLSQRNLRNTLERKCCLRLDNIEENLGKIMAYIEQNKTFKKHFLH